MASLIARNHLIIADWIRPGARVLDLGCGNGTLLKALIESKAVKGIGVERSQDMLVQCLRKGLSVYQADINQDLSYWDDASFDYVILNATLQEISHPSLVMREMLRVGEYAIITVSNFGYIRNRLRVLCAGRVSALIRPAGAWHDTPVIRFVSLQEFYATLDEMQLAVSDACFLLPFNRIFVGDLPLKTLLAQEGIFKLKRLR